MSFKWIGKALVQKTLAYLPGGVRVNTAISEYICRTLPPSWADSIDTVLRHLSSLLPLHPTQLAGAIWVEVGPGWAPVTAVTFYLAGVGHQCLFDRCRHFRAKYIHHMLVRLESHLDCIASLANSDEDAVRERYERIKGSRDLSLLDLAGISYCAPADGTETQLPTSSVDAVTSTLVLEHVSPNVLSQFCREWWRILRPGGVMSHIVDHSDHYSHFDRSISPVNFLKFSETVWRLLSSGLSYCNRLRERDYITMFLEEGFEIARVEPYTDPRALNAVACMSLAPEFREMSPQELAVTRSHIVARKTK